LTRFHDEITRRLATTQESLRLAVEAGEPFLVDVHVGELESLARLAADHGVTVAGVPETLLSYGVTPPVVRLPVVA
jgi:hypothetical protein